MATEISLQSRLARHKLTTNLVLLNNASVRTADRVHEVSKRSKLANGKIKNGDRKFKNWLPSIFSGILILLIFLISELQRFLPIALSLFP